MTGFSTKMVAVAAAGLALAAAGAFDFKEAPKDPRRDQVNACVAAIKAQLDDPKSAIFPNYWIDPAAFTRGENNALEPIETFEFRARNAFGGMVRAGAYCAYDEDGKLAAANIE